MHELSVVSWVVAALSAMMIGVSKTGLPGVGILAITWMATVIPARASTGLILPMLIAGDVIAVALYRRHAVWSHLLKFLPCAAAGVLIGWKALAHVNDRQLRPIIGGIILAMLALNYWRQRLSGDDAPIPRGWWFAVAMGLFAGITTMMANAAGPIMIIYLLAMRLPKVEFIGTSAWYFLLVNLFKVPLSANLGLITLESLRFNLMLLPALAVGGLLGVRLARRIPEKAFNAVVEVLAVIGAAMLLWPA